jgi:uncharacterized protein YjbI with pentapeptide repeats
MGLSHEAATCTMDSREGWMAGCYLTPSLEVTAMANPEHLEILKQGVEVWNKWRTENPGVTPNLRDANLIGADLRAANLWMADVNNTDLTDAILADADLILSMLHGAKLVRADLSRADLSRADLGDTDLTDANLNNARFEEATLSGASLRRANLEHANLRQAFLFDANLIEANLENANLQTADLRNARLGNANLKKAYLGGANFTGATIKDADFSGASTSETIFGYNELGSVQGLESIEHKGPSIIGTETLSLSNGTIPEVFLRGCGLSDWEIESAKLHQSSLSNEEITNVVYRIHDLRAHQAIQINPLFISYSHVDSPFVDEIEKYLKEKGVRFWRDIHHSVAGRMEKQIDLAIRLNPTVLLVLSSHSVQSDWVEHEARLARKLEIETKRDVLCPVALDDSWKDCAWPERLREQIMEYNILDFSDWNNEFSFRQMFNRLLDGLDLFYK